MRKLASRPPMREQRWWLGLAGMAVALLLAAVVWGAPTRALPVEQGRALPGVEVRPAVASGSILGRVLLEARDSFTSGLSIPLQVKLYQGDGSIYTATLVTTDESGYFGLTDLPVATYDVWVKGAHTLAERQNGISVVMTPTVQLEFGPLIEGDANNDNQIGAVDASFLSNGYWKARGQAGYVAGADFNEDGIIDARDASLLANNYGQVGD